MCCYEFSFTSYMILAQDIFSPQGSHREGISQLKLQERTSPKIWPCLFSALITPHRVAPSGGFLLALLCSQACPLQTTGSDF